MHAAFGADQCGAASFEDQLLTRLAFEYDQQPSLGTESAQPFEILWKLAFQPQADLRREIAGGSGERRQRLHANDCIEVWSESTSELSGEFGAVYRLHARPIRDIESEHFGIDGMLRHGRINRRRVAHPPLDVAQ